MSLISDISGLSIIVTNGNEDRILLSAMHHATPLSRWQFAAWDETEVIAGQPVTMSIIPAIPAVETSTVNTSSVTVPNQSVSNNGYEYYLTVPRPERWVFIMDDDTRHIFDVDGTTLLSQLQASFRAVFPSLVISVSGSTLVIENVPDLYRLKIQRDQLTKQIDSVVVSSFEMDGTTYIDMNGEGSWSFRDGGGELFSLDLNSGPYDTSAIINEIQGHGTAYDFTAVQIALISGDNNETLTISGLPSVIEGLHTNSFQYDAEVEITETFYDAVATTTEISTSSQLILNVVNDGDSYRVSHGSILDGDSTALAAAITGVSTRTKFSSLVEFAVFLFRRAGAHATIADAIGFDLKAVWIDQPNARLILSSLAADHGQESVSLFFGSDEERQFGE